jgi:ribosomal protein S18 acetylase RimI-like enzyme
MRIRRYVDDDRGGCLALLRSNVPQYFTPEDEDSFARFLAAPPGLFFVVEEAASQLIACGGIAGREPTMATLCWGIVDRGRQRTGVGTALLRHRLASFLPDHRDVRTVRVNTTQKVQGFFERHGFRATNVRVGAYGPGLDHVQMEWRAPAA